MLGFSLVVTSLVVVPCASPWKCEAIGAIVVREPGVSQSSEDYRNVHHEVGFSGVVCYVRISAIQLWNSENYVSLLAQTGTHFS